jgi:hypothetical protein
MNKHWDKIKREGAPEGFVVGNYVISDGRNIQTKHAGKKLDAQLYGLFRITRIRCNSRVAILDLPPRWRIHLRFPYYPTGTVPR